MQSPCLSSASPCWLSEVVSRSSSWSTTVSPSLRDSVQHSPPGKFDFSNLSLSFFFFLYSLFLFCLLVIAGPWHDPGKWLYEAHMWHFASHLSCLWPIFPQNVQFSISGSPFEISFTTSNCSHSLFISPLGVLVMNFEQICLLFSHVAPDMQNQTNCFNYWNILPISHLDNLIYFLKKFDNIFVFALLQVK